MARRWRAVPLLLALAGSGLAGCAVPGETDVTLDGPAQQRGASTGGSVVVAQGPGGATDPEELVKRYLRAGADGPKGAAEKLRAFLLPGTAWQPGPELTVIRPLSDPVKTSLGGNLFEVTVEVLPVGVLTDRGFVVEPTARTAHTLRFKVAPSRGRAQDQQDVPQGADELRISSPPPGMYLTSAALAGVDALYQPYPVYFWDSTGGILVPDLRYLPLTATKDERRRLLVQWVVGGPSDWLNGAVRALPSEIVLRSNVVYSENRIVVDLTAQAATADLTRLAKQLAWTLRPVYNGPIELRVEGQPKLLARASDSPTANPALPYAGAPMSFCVVSGKVIRDCTTGQELAILNVQQNSRVVAAAVAANKQYAALVRTEAGGRRRLVVGVWDGGTAAYTTTSLSGAVMSRPAWLPPIIAARGLIAVDGRLYAFAAGSARTSAVEISVGDVTGVSVAPDGRRVVIAAGGGAYVATLMPKGDTLVLQRLRRLPSSLTGVSAVAWSRLDRVVLLGRDGGRHALTELTTDGAVEDRLGVQFGEAVVTQLSAYPDFPDYPENPDYSDYPRDGSARGAILIESQGKAWRVFAADHKEIKLGLAPGTSPVPGSAVPVPMAPFFQD